MIQDIINMLADLEGTTSKNEKIAILKAANSDDVLVFLEYALDPYKKFYIRKIPRHTPSGKVDDFKAMITLLDRLYKREVTGGTAISLVTELLNNCSVAGSDVFQRMITKDLKCGTKVGIVNAAFPDLVPEFNVQLAAQWDEKKVTWPRIAEPKIDGMRALAFIEGPEPEDVVFLSRAGKPIETMFEIAEQLVERFPEGTVLDGEAKNRIGVFEASQSFVKRKTAKAGADIVFYIFDCLTMEEFAAQETTVPYEKRRERFVPHIAALKNVEILPNDWVDDEAEAIESFGRRRLEGHEGLILKEPNGVYDFKRSRTWMKMKPSETMDVEITGYEEGKKGKRLGKLGAFLFNYNGEVCRCGGGYSDEQLVEFWENRDKMIGDIIEVEFMEKTAKGKTRHCNFIRSRTFKGEKC